MRSLVLACLVLVWTDPGAAQTAGPSAGPAPATLPASGALDSPSAPSLEQQERFLRDAPIVAVRGERKGTTGTRRASLADGAIRHDASIQTVDVSKVQFQSAKGTEIGFRDYWGYNVAAYRLGLLVGLDMIPPSVARRFRTEDAAFTWWVDDVILDEAARVAEKRTPPDPATWTAQMHAMRVFDELIANTDRNQGNLLIDKHWRVWLIDHTRAFRTTHSLREPRQIIRCERPFFDGMKALTLPRLAEELGRYLTQTQLAALLARRDLLVQRLESLGPAAIHEPAPR